jgi:predicted ribosomally synthesized peptide with SipW-like signal peptide
MLRRIIYSGGILGILSLVFVQSGSFAAFTATASVKNNIETGKFSLAVTPDSNSVTVTGVDSFDANYATQAGGSLSNITPSQLQLNLGYLTPGITYSYSFNVWDNGTLQGLVNNIVYTPTTNPNINQYDLEKDLTVQIYDGQGNLMGTTTANNPYTFSTNGYTGVQGDGGHYFGPDFIQPEPNGTTGVTEGSATYKVVITYAGGYYNNNYGTNPLISQNNEEGVTIAPLLTVNGNTL